MSKEKSKDQDINYEDPQEVIEKRLTPRALERAEELLNSDNEKIAADQIRDILDRDSRTSRKNALIDNRSVNVMNFDPKYLVKAMQTAQLVLKDADFGRKDDTALSNGSDQAKG